MCFMLAVCGYAVRLVAIMLQEFAIASLRPSSCVGDLVGSDDVYSFSTSKQLDEDLADAEALLRSRRATCEALRLNNPAMHKVEAVRLDEEVSRAKLRLGIAQVALDCVVDSRNALVDTDSGKRSRYEYEVDLLRTLTAGGEKGLWCLETAACCRCRRRVVFG